MLYVIQNTKTKKFLTNTDCSWTTILDNAAVYYSKFIARYYCNGLKKSPNLEKRSKVIQVHLNIKKEIK